eukprot:1847627-Prymnesium_polylepis.1
MRAKSRALDETRVTCAHNSLEMGYRESTEMRVYTPSATATCRVWQSNALRHARATTPVLSSAVVGMRGRSLRIVSSWFGSSMSEQMAAARSADTTE